MKRRSLALLMTAACLTAPARADDRATAQRLFQEGKQLMSEGRTEDACRKFEGAAQLSQTPGVRLNLSECFTRLGRLASAWARYEEALALAERSGDHEAAEVARAGRAALEPRLSYLTILVPAHVVVPGLQVLRDGETLPQAAWNSAVPVDTGDHLIVASAPGHHPWSIRKTVAGEGARLTVELLPLAREASPPRAPRTTPAPYAPNPPIDRPPAPTPGWQRPVGLAVAGLGLVGIGVGSYFGLRASSKKDDYERHRGSDGACLDLDCQTLSREAYRSGNASTISFVAGGALVAAGLVIWLTAPSSSSKTSAIAPMAATHGAGLQYKGTW